ncbi:MAG: hypothetical protein K2O14_03975 [Oscillospiraceae bacterium]|nr:hypothetical protein [Oscillospiraceae bacterium]
MGLIVSQIRTTLDESRDNAIGKALSLLCVGRSEVKNAALYKTSVDARREVCFVNSVYVELKSAALEKKLALRRDNVKLYRREELSVEYGTDELRGDIFIAGFGPAGMFCALTLCEFGYKPVVLERGAPMEQRIRDVESYWGGGALNISSNVQFGEGGAGTFSDGKLTTRIGDPLCARVLDRLVRFGAPEEILLKAKPHIGTDRLRDVVTNLRNEVIRLGGEVRFLSPLEDIGVQNGRVCSVTVNGGELPCGALVAAIGHSAHDTFEMLLKRGITLLPKPFSVGARIEHLQEDIDRALYGKYAGHPALPPAEYQLSYHDKNNRGVYTFCMCPGGYVVASESGNGTIVTNGMSRFARDGVNANSAVLVSAAPEDFGQQPLAGVEFIHRLEQRAYEMTRGTGKAPAMLTREFVGSGGGLSIGKVTPTYPRGVESANLRELFPDYVSEPLAEGLEYFNRRIRDFSDSDSVLTAIETRSSSPVRIPRGENGAAMPADNLYPCGEGAGYAGGIMSAAVDGIKTAIKIMERYKKI